MSFLFVRVSRAWRSPQITQPCRSFAQAFRPTVLTRLPIRSRVRPRARIDEAARASQQKRFRQAFNYNQYRQSQNLLRRWTQSRTFYYQLAGIGVVGGTYYYMHLEDVPVSHRRRFRNISYESEKELGGEMFQQTLAEFGRQILPEMHPYTQMVKRVAKRLIPHSGLQNDQWEVFVIDSPEMNAFVIPGGKIFVFRGMFDVCKTDDSLAAVIGHEIGHNVAHHAAERASQNLILTLVSYVLYFVSGVDIGLQSQLLTLVFAMPGSRAQESEADYIGLLMMSEACYDPRAAMDMWAKMEQMDKQGMPQWLSTHPSNHNRMEKIRGWLPVAEEKAADSGCRITASHAADFWSQNAKQPGMLQRKNPSVT